MLVMMEFRNFGENNQVMVYKTFNGMEGMDRWTHPFVQNCIKTEYFSLFNSVPLHCRTGGHK